MLDYAAFWVVLALIAFVLGYRFYSRFLARRIFATAEDDSVTPAFEFEDGIDYVPTTKHVVLGHHFTSIAGAAPIVGPAVACVYGWVPAFLWIVIGVIFIGAMHDFSALAISLRHKGKSIGDIAGELIGERPRVLFLCLIVILTWLVLAAFASVIASLFVKYEASVVPVNLEIPLAIACGWWFYRKKGGILIPSLIALGIMWGSVFVAANTPALQWGFPAEGIAGFSPAQLWVGILLAYSFVTCLLPVWVLLQPRDFINSHQLFVGLGVIYVAIFVGNPQFTAPAFNPEPDSAYGPLFPMLFVTIACGAVSGFHSLVASGTTSKQLSSVRDARAVGYGSMLGEGCLAIAATVAVAAGLADWAAHYHTKAAFDASGGAIEAFVKGTSNLLDNVFAFGNDTVTQTIVAVIVISFAATTLDTACRIQRYCLGELGKAWRIKPLSNRYVASGIAAFTPIALVVSQDGGLPLWKQVWPVFGSSNQMLGALTLLTVTIWLKRKGKPIFYTGIPAVVLAGITVAGLLSKAGGELSKAADARSYVVLIPSVLLLLLALAIIIEGLIALGRPNADATAADE